MLLSWNNVTQVFLWHSRSLGSERRIGAGRRTKKEEENWALHPHSTFTATKRKRGLFFFPSASCTMASKMSYCYFSTLDHSVLSFQLFLTLYSKPFFIFTKTSNNWFLRNLSIRTFLNSSFCIQPRIRWIIFPILSLNQHYPLLHILHLLIQFGLASWVWDQCSHRRLHA